MLSDNVYLPTDPPPGPPSELPNVPIIPTVHRKPPPIEIPEMHVETPIITAAGAHTHPAPPGGGADIVREHLQSDSSRRRTGRKSEAQDGRYEGDWASEEGETGFKFVPEEGEISGTDKTVLWGIAGATALWGLFGPRNKSRK
jgi:hypothetical protein